MARPAQVAGRAWLAKPLRRSASWQVLQAVWFGPTAAFIGSSPVPATGTSVATTSANPTMPLPIAPASASALGRVPSASQKGAVGAGAPVFRDAKLHQQRHVEAALEAALATAPSFTIFMALTPERRYPVAYCKIP